MYTVFLTGGIGSGKSTACSYLRDKGACAIDLDLIARDVLREPRVMLALARQFGKDVISWPQGLDAAALSQAYAGIDEVPDEVLCALDGEVAVDRRTLAARAFATPEDTAALNAITHPRILERLGEVLTGVCCMGSREKVAVVEVPLIESFLGGLSLADEVLALSCPVEKRRERAVERGMDPADFDARNARQATDGQRAFYADTVVANEGDPTRLAALLDAWWASREEAGWVSSRTSDRADVRRDSDLPALPNTPCLQSPSIAFVGRHNSGKTTLVTKVIACLSERGVDVGSIKHHGHAGFEIDVPGKDSWRHREAGANEVAVCSPDRLALTRELDAPMEASQIVNMMRPHDVVIVEGYRHSGIPAIEIMRSGNERDRIAAAEFVRAVAAGERFEFDPTVLGHDADRMPDGLTVGVASDLPEVRRTARACGLAAFDLDDPAAISDYIIENVMHR